MKVNMKAIKDYVKANYPDLRVGKDFLEQLDGMLQAAVDHAVQRNVNEKRVTLKPMDLSEFNYYLTTDEEDTDTHGEVPPIAAEQLKS